MQGDNWRELGSVVMLTLQPSFQMTELNPSVIIFMNSLKLMKSQKNLQERLLVRIPHGPFGDQFGTIFFKESNSYQDIDTMVQSPSCAV